MTDQNQSLVQQIDRDLELQRCLKYMMLNQKGQTKQEMAEALGYTDRRALYYALERWERDGILEEARNLYLVPLVEETNRAIDEVVRDFPDVLRNWRDIALGRGKHANASSRVQWEASQSLMAEVVRPALEKHVSSGATEASYAEALERGLFDPVNLIEGQIVEDQEE